MPKRLTPRGEAAPPVEPVVTGATAPPKPAAKKSARPRATKAGVKYIRNLHNIQARVKLASGRDVNLAPRGQREDLDIVNADERQDPKYLANLDLVFELVEPAEAEEIIAKQQTNSNRRETTLWDHLRNEKGEGYEQRETRIEEAFERQGIVVGEVKETGSGRHTDKNVEITRTASPNIVQAPGSPEHAATEYMQSVPSEISPEEYHDFLIWKKNQEGK